MEVQDIIAVLAILATIIVAFIGWSKDKQRDDKQEDSIIVEIRTEMRYNNKKLDSIDKRLDSIEEKLDDNAIKVGQHGRDIKTLFNEIDLIRKETIENILKRMRRLENAIGFKGESESE